MDLSGWRDQMRMVHGAILQQAVQNRPYNQTAERSREAVLLSDVLRYSWYSII